MTQPEYKDHKKFCEIDQWEVVASATGKTPDHYRFKKLLRDGRLLRTKVSHGRGQYRSPSLWKHIWHDQLALENEQQFWDALSSGDPVVRPGDAAPTPPAERLPRGLFLQVVKELRMSERAAAQLTTEEATRLLHEHRTGPAS